MKVVTAPLPLTSLGDHIAALAPDEGETVGDVFNRGEPHPKASELKPDAHGFMWLPDKDLAEACAPNAYPDEQAIMAALQRPMPVE
jgi:hypothetical protein